MQKIFQYIGLITLMCFSFFVTEKTSMIAKNVDSIMIDIKENYEKYEITPIDAKIVDNKIIPGSCGKKVNIDSSYMEMKKVGIYDDKLYEYVDILPTVALANNYDKIVISGNSEREDVYLFIELNESNKKYVNLYNFVNYNFIISSNFYEDNEEIIKKLIENGNSVILEKISYKEYKKISKDYFDKTGNQLYCYNVDEDSSFLETCSSNNSNTISSIERIDSNFLLNVKSKLKRGLFLNIKLSKELVDNIKFIEDYIVSKGMIISSVDESLKEC